MVKCEVIENFSLKDFNKLKNIKRKSADVNGSLYEGDTFECDEKMAKYLTGDNALEKVVVKVIEVELETKVNELGNPDGTRKLLKELAVFDYISKLPQEVEQKVEKNEEICYNKPTKKGRKKKEV